jgi:hypothetical protein
MFLFLYVGGGVPCAVSPHANLNAVGGVLQGFTPVPEALTQT